MTMTSTTLKPFFGTKPFGRVKTHLQGVVRYIQHQREMRLLMEMSDRALTDMGIDRSQVRARLNIPMREYRDRFLR